MPLETGTTIADLDKLWPIGGDPLHQGDDHLRLIKAILKTQFPGALGLGFDIPITATEEELNNLSALDASGKVNKTGDIMTGQLVIDLLGSVKNALAILNDTGGFQLVIQSNGNIEIVSTDNNQGSEQAEYSIERDVSASILVAGSERLKATTSGGSLTNNWTAVTQSAGDQSTKLATTAFVTDGIDTAVPGYRYASLWTGANTSGTFALSEPITNFDVISFVAGGNPTWNQHHSIPVEHVIYNTTHYSACSDINGDSNGGIIVLFPNANQITIVSSFTAEALKEVYGQKY